MDFPTITEEINRLSRVSPHFHFPSSSPNSVPNAISIAIISTCIIDYTNPPFYFCPPLFHASAFPEQCKYQLSLVISNPMHQLPCRCGNHVVMWRTCMHQQRLLQRQEHHQYTLKSLLYACCFTSKFWRKCSHLLLFSKTLAKDKLSPP